MAWREYDERRYRWDLTRLAIETQGGRLDEFPDYVSPEDGQLDPALIEARLDRLLGPGIDVASRDGTTGVFTA